MSTEYTSSTGEAFKLEQEEEEELSWGYRCDKKKQLISKGKKKKKKEVASRAYFLFSSTCSIEPFSHIAGRVGGPSSCEFKKYNLNSPLSSGQ